MLHRRELGWSGRISTGVILKPSLTHTTSRAFTPQLAEWYKQFKEHSPNGAKFEIIFVSSDRDETSFKEYFADMPWLALPYEHRDMKVR